jgi:hypothetical protein
LNLRPSGYEPDELPDCSTPRQGVYVVTPAVFLSIRSALLGFAVARARVFCVCLFFVFVAINPPFGGRVWHCGTGVFFRSAFCPLLGRPGGDLLSHALRRSTIGAKGFHGRVRDGIGWDTLAITTKPSKQRCNLFFSHTVSPRCVFPHSMSPRNVSVSVESNRTPLHGFCAWMIFSQVYRAISTGKLHALLRFHTRPINVVVFHGSQGRSRLEGGFPLRCFQRLSRPNLATQLCGWRHNWSTRGSSTPVLSY